MHRLALFRLVPIGLFLGFTLLIFVLLLMLFTDVAQPDLEQAARPPTRATEHTTPMPLANRQRSDAEAGTVTMLGTPARVTSTPAVFSRESPEHAAFATRVAQNRAARATVIALTPFHPRPGGPPLTNTPAPLPTIIDGWVECGIVMNQWLPRPFNCWMGVVDGQIIHLVAGSEGCPSRSPDCGIPGHDPRRGVLIVSHLLPDLQLSDYRVYQTPERSGGVRIVSVIGGCVTLASEEPETIFVFDLATSHWRMGVSCAAPPNL
jgi:hypothetical protein